MKTIEINSTLIVLDKVAAVQFNDSLGGDRALIVYLVGAAAPLYIHGASSGDYAALTAALAAA